MNTAITPANHGLFFARPLKSSISSASWPARDSSMIMPKVPSEVSTSTTT